MKPPSVKDIADFKYREALRKPDRRGTLVWKYDAETDEVVRVFKCSRCGDYFMESRWALHRCKGKAPSFSIR